MPAVADVVAVSTTVAAATPTVPGFGVPLVAANKCPAGFTNRVRAYTGTAAMLTDGFASSHPAVTAVAQALAQNPAPPQVLVGRRANASVWTIKLLLGSTTAGDVYSVTLVNTLTGVTTTVTRTGVGTAITDATAFAASIAAVSGFAASSGGTATITITASGGAGIIHRLKNWVVNGTRASTLYLTDTTADPGLAADMTAIRAENDTWYGMTIDSPSKAEIAAGAAWAETNKKLFATQSSESDVPDATETTNNIATVLKNSSYTYTGVLYDGNDTQAFAGLAWQANRFAGAPTPGGDTWLFKTLVGVAVDTLSETEVQTLANKNATGYCTIANNNQTWSGAVANGNSGGTCASGMFIDVRRGIDWNQALIQIGIFAALVNAPKIPYTDKGLGSLGNVISGALQKGEESGLYTPGSTTVTVLPVASQTSGDRGIRKANGLNWTGTLAGAVHLAQVQGTAS